MAPPAPVVPRTVTATSIPASVSISIVIDIVSLSVITPAPTVSVPISAVTAPLLTPLTIAIAPLIFSDLTVVVQAPILPTLPFIPGLLFSITLLPLLHFPERRL
mmetsp:Transcript_16630/g.46961  ORF Transcript_16630/g.46961 Transcript_16630/m.46961 type:complete len:104 (+) Transcript_16630:1331-1642(+)